MRIMKHTGTIGEFSLLGGPFHRLACRLGLIRGGTNTFLLGVVLGLFLWIVLIALTLIEDISEHIFSLSVIGSHVRLLVAIPLFFLCEMSVNPRMTAFVRLIVRSEIVPRNALPILEALVARITRWKDFWLPDAMCLLAAVLLSLMGTKLGLSSTTAAFDPRHAVGEVILTAQWYWIVCLPLFRFLMFRWLWRLGLWSYFLWRVANLELHLVPTHPDGAAGLGYLEIVQIHFAPLILVISVIQSASSAEEILAGTMSFEALYPAVAMILFVDALLFLGPLFLFAPKLWTCRVKGLSDYMEFAMRYVNGFDKKWLGADASPEPLLGTPDLQSLADLDSSISIVRDMRLVPVSLRLLTNLLMAALVPILPLLLLKYPVAELAEKFFRSLTGI
ncbi:MAG: hypothetical protein JXL20_04360 [Deltaproteobacteria bacterium]|nr:hypothetical protein [Deltaproteobacteria bacterium]